MKKLRVTVDGKVFEVLVESLDEPAAPSAAPAPVASPVAATPAPAPVAAAPAPSAAVPSGPAGPGDVQSPLAGRVVSLDVQVGQEVKADQPLLTLEAMKMNTVISAPKAGKVSEIFVNAGDAVEEGKVLIRIS